MYLSRSLDHICTGVLSKSSLSFFQRTSATRLLAFALVLIVPSAANGTNLDLFGATTSTLISAPGGSFASLFAGQSLSGNTDVSGLPTGPLSLQPANSLIVLSFDPGVSSLGNSILPQPDNLGPLSLLLDTPATSITWTMGSADSNSSIDIDFFDDSGTLIHSTNQSFDDGYAIYTLSGFGAFRGLSFRDNNDPAGVRFMNFSYVAVPEPSTLWLLGSCAAGCMTLRRRW